MHWNRLPNIWYKYIQPAHRIRHLIQAFRPLGFDYQKAAEQCRIRLHHHETEDISDHVTECTVQEAINDYLRPGRYMVPKQLAITSDNVQRLLPVMAIDYDNTFPYYSAIGDYVLVNLNTELSSNSEMVTKRGPQIILMDALPDTNRDERVLSKAFQALKAGKTTTIAVMVKYRLTRLRPEPQESIEEHQKDVPLLLHGEESLRQPSHGALDASTRSGSGAVAENNNTAHDRTLTQDASVVHIRAEPQSTPETQLLVSESQELVDELDSEVARLALAAANSAFLFQDEPADGTDEAGLLAVQEVQQNSPSSETKLDDSDGVFTNASTGDVQDSGIYHTSDDADASKSSVTPSISSEQDNTILQYTPEGIREEPFSASSGVLTQDESTQDRPYTLLRTPDVKFFYPADGTFRVLSWATKHMPHLWPTVIEACMPPGCKVDIQPETNGALIQYVIQPPIRDAVRSMLHDADLRESDDWL